MRLFGGLCSRRFLLWVMTRRGKELGRGMRGGCEAFFYGYSRPSGRIFLSFSLFVQAKRYSKIEFVALMTQISDIPFVITNAVFHYYNHKRSFAGFC